MGIQCCKNYKEAKLVEPLKVRYWKGLKMLVGLFMSNLEKIAHDGVQMAYSKAKKGLKKRIKRKRRIKLKK